MLDPYDPISLNLWDLRAQLESQLRCLTKIHKRYEQLQPEGDPARAASLRDMRQDMADVITANASIRDVATESLEALNAIPD